MNKNSQLLMQITESINENKFSNKKAIEEIKLFYNSKEVNN
jgi:hypothetical protein